MPPDQDQPAGFDTLTAIMPLVATYSIFFSKASSESRHLELGADLWVLYSTSGAGAVMKRVAGALNDNYAVQALGWDLLIALGSGMVRYCVL